MCNKYKIKDKDFFVLLGSLACSSLSEDAPAFLVSLEETANAGLSNGASFVF